MEPVVTEETHVNLGHVTDVVPLLGALSRLGATLFLEGTAIADDVLAALAAHKTTATRTDLSGTVWPDPISHHFTLTGRLVDVLRELADRSAQPELCDHLVVYRGNLIMLAAYDAGADDVWVSRDLPQATIDQLRALVREQST